MRRMHRRLPASWTSMPLSRCARKQLQRLSLVSHSRPCIENGGGAAGVLADWLDMRLIGPRRQLDKLSCQPPSCSPPVLGRC